MVEFDPPTYYALNPSNLAVYPSSYQPTSHLPVEPPYLHISQHEDPGHTHTSLITTQSLAVTVVVAVMAAAVAAAVAVVRAVATAAQAAALTVVVVVLVLAVIAVVVRLRSSDYRE